VGPVQVIMPIGRRCLAIEIEPRYAQVAIERWQAFTGRKAVAL
jgi:DNA modification methylase